MKSKRKKKILRLVSIYCELMSKKMKDLRKTNPWVGVCIDPRAILCGAGRVKRI